MLIPLEEKLCTYPARSPPILEAPEPVSPPESTRAVLERRRREARGRAALMMDVRYMVDWVRRAIGDGREWFMWMGWDWVRWSEYVRGASRGR